MAIKQNVTEIFTPPRKTKRNDNETTWQYNKMTMKQNDNKITWQGHEKEKVTTPMAMEQNDNETKWQWNKMIL